MRVWQSMRHAKTRDLGDGGVAIYIYIYGYIKTYICICIYIYSEYLLTQAPVFVLPDLSPFALYCFLSAFSIHRPAFPSPEGGGSTQMSSRKASPSWSEVWREHRIRRTQDYRPQSIMKFQNIPSCPACLCSVGTAGMNPKETTRDGL